MRVGIVKPSESNSACICNTLHACIPLERSNAQNLMATFDARHFSMPITQYVSGPLSQIRPCGASVFCIFILDVAKCLMSLGTTLGETVLRFNGSKRTRTPFESVSKSPSVDQGDPPSAPGADAEVRSPGAAPLRNAQNSEPLHDTVTSFARTQYAAWDGR